jgi:hypothetical protein
MEVLCMTNTLSLKEIKRELRINGEVTINNINIVLNGIGEAEVSKNDQYEFTATNWCEVEDYLIENNII